jgi:hypothetical protein
VLGGGGRGGFCVASRWPRAFPLRVEFVDFLKWRAQGRRRQLVFGRDGARPSKLNQVREVWRYFLSVRVDQQPHQFAAGFSEMRATALTGDNATHQMGVIDRAFFDVSQFRLRHLMIARLDF